MSQESIWEKEYHNPQLVTGSTEPQNDFKRFVKWLKKTRETSLEDLRVLDLGSGLGKNAIFLAERGAHVVGMEISKKAIEVATVRARNNSIPSTPSSQIYLGIHPKHYKEGNATVDSDIRQNDTEVLTGSISFLHADIGSPYAFADSSFDLVLDIMSSNSLDEQGRSVYLKEVNRVLKSEGYFFVRTLARDGDKNAENLLRNHPGKEKDTYVMPELNLIEHVFSTAYFTQMYEKCFTILKLETKYGYAQFKGRVFKRNYLLAYMQK